MSKYSRGIDFEVQATKMISDSLQAQFIFDYYLIRDVAYKGVNRYEQVDCMLLSTYGIYCFEYKNWNGEVRPSNLPEWQIYNGGRPTDLRYPNPVKQNERHTATLKFLLDKYYEMFKEENIPIYNVVVFSDNTYLSGNDKSNVMYADEVGEYVAKHNRNISPTIVEDTLRIVKKIRSQCLPEYERLHKHQIESLNRK